MGALLSNLTKIDSIINPDTSNTPKGVDAEVEVKNESVTESTDSTVKTPVESDLIVPKETEAEVKSELNTIVSNKVNETSKEELSEELPKEGKKVEVVPVDISKVADVIKKPTRKHKRHHIS